ncbi:MAG: serine/threonine protein phosphatase [SAR324 cluster bacterium]|nr:serine/threonine protein phosphatase [SAR324 cluster bacterium]
MTIAIGDIHGCLEPLESLVDKLPRDDALVFLGDYVDRGPQSAQVIDYLKDLARQRHCRFLMGNHEVLMVKAIQDEKAIPIWLYNGGDATLKSYGLSSGDWVDSKHRSALLPGFMDFYRALSLYHEDESAIYVHAGIDVSIENMAAQDSEVLLWIRDKFFRNSAKWNGKPIVFGHTPTRTMGLDPGSIFKRGAFYGIDTGCVYGGHLTAMDTTTFELYQQPYDLNYQLASSLGSHT